MFDVKLPQVGGNWDGGSLVWGERAGRGDWLEQRSPADGSLVQRTRLLNAEELSALAAPRAPFLPMSRGEFGAFASRLGAALCDLRAPLRDAMQRETAFVSADCDEMLCGCLAFVGGFLDSVGRTTRAAPVPLGYSLPHGSRRIRQVPCPRGTVAVILPQNAFLLVAVTALLNALWTGSRALLRAPQQSARSAALLATALEAAQAPPGAVSVVLARAKDFVGALCQSPAPCLLHYMGGSGHAPAILSQAFDAGKGALIDGQGNGWCFVGEDADPALALDVLTRGALRYNGQTCTSVNGAVIHPALYAGLRDRLLERWRRLRVGNPLTEDAAVGPLFDEAQAAHCERLVAGSGGRVLCGGEPRGNLLPPTLVEGPSPASELVTHGLFGGALWIAPGTAEDFSALWPRNRYPLCAGVLSASAEAPWWLARLPNVARLTVNGDPSIEDVFAPWGGYPGSGANPVGPWHEPLSYEVPAHGAG